MSSRAFKFVTRQRISTPRQLGTNRGHTHQEIVRYTSRNQWLSGPRSWIELEAGRKGQDVSRVGLGKERQDLQAIRQLLVYLHDSRLITAPITVVRCTEDCHHVSILSPIIACWRRSDQPSRIRIQHTFHNELMGPCNEREAVVVIESLRDILSKCVASATRRDTPATTVIRIGPEEITHRSFVRDLLHPVDRPHMVKSIN